MLYKYQAKKITGEETSGTMEASNKTDLAVKLREQGYIPTLVEEKTKSPVRHLFCPASVLFPARIK